MKRLISHIAIVLALVLAAACSTTSRLADGEELYNGIKKLTVTPDSGKTLPGGLRDEISDAVAVKPNNPWPMTNIRNPFPFGLWVWNHWSGHTKGIKHWVYEKFASEPVLISEVRPDIRTQMIDQVLENNGYFHGKASYELVPKRNPSIVSVNYNVTTGPAYHLDSIELLPDTALICRYVNNIARRMPYLKRGNRYSTDSLKSARKRITGTLRNLGYYFFMDDYIEYLADTINFGPHGVGLRVTLAKNVPAWATRQYKVGNVVMTVRRNDRTGTPDTIGCTYSTLVQYMPSRFRRQLVDECVILRPGRNLSTVGVNLTQSRLSRLGIFNNIDINVNPPDSTHLRGSNNRLDVTVDCTLDMPLEASIEANVSSKSNSYLGPGITLGINNRNMFGGGEQLSVTLTGSYEWQTGHNRSSVFNSYEVSLQGSLAFPRLLAPRFVPRSWRDIAWTRFTLNGEVLNRPHYFRMAQFNASMNYDWNPTRNTTSTLTLLKLTYNNLLHTTHEFDSIMGENRAIAESFRSQFVPQIMYTYTYNRTFNRANQVGVTATVQEAGGLFCSLWRLAGAKHDKRLFNIPISQFVKASAQLVYGRRLGWGDTWLMFRAAAGVAHAYGNSQQVPYSEQFWVGGANSVRAFTVRSLGPGSYRPEKGNYFDQTGTFKFEANMELRFPLIGPLHGAVFLDSGNVWLLRNDPQRPGGQLRAGSFLRDLALGTGLGLRVDIGILVIRGDLGIGIHAPYSTGKSGYYNMTSFKNSLAFHLAIGYPF